MDPLATPSDRENEDGSEGGSYRDNSDIEGERSDSDAEEPKVDRQLAHSEEIIVVSNSHFLFRPSLK